MPDTDSIRLGLDAVQTALILIGGTVAAYEYWRFRRYGHKAQLDVNFDLLPLQQPPNSYVLEVCTVVKNMGRIRQKFPLIQVWARTLTDSDIADAQSSGDELKFGRLLLRSDNIVDDSKDPYFVDPGVTESFRYRAVISEPGDYVLVATRFFYPVSLLTYVWLRLVVYPRKLRECGKDRKQRERLQRRVERLKEHRTHHYHIASKVKPTPKTKA